MNFQKTISKDQNLPFFFYDPTCSAFQNKIERFALKRPVYTTLKPLKNRYKNILILRYGGFGDLLFLTPYLSRIKEISPGTEINIFTHEKSVFITYHNSDIDCLITCNDYWEFTDFIKDKNNFSGFEQVYDLTASIGGSIESEYKNVYEIIAEHLGLKFISDAVPKVIVAKKEQEEAEKKLKEAGVDTNKPFVVIHPEGTTEYKFYNPDELIKLCDSLSKSYQVIVLGKFSTLLSFVLDTIDNCHSLIDRTSFRTALAILTHPSLKLFIGIDSVFLHCAVAFGKKVLGLYGSLDPYVYTKTYKNCWVLKSDYSCSPCFKQGTRKGCETECMKILSAEMVERNAVSLLNDTKPENAVYSQDLKPINPYFISSFLCPICGGKSLNFARKANSIWKQCQNCLTLFKIPFNINIKKVFSDSLKSLNGESLQIGCADFADIDIIQPIRTGRYSFVHINNNENKCVLGSKAVQILSDEINENVKIVKDYNNLTMILRGD
jgi:ADP-heptose:LPS heptosyltransferase